MPRCFALRVRLLPHLEQQYKRILIGMLTNPPPHHG